MPEYPKESDSDPTLADGDHFAGMPGAQEEESDLRPALDPLLSEERESISEAEATILLAQYRELHNRLDDYTVWLVESGFLAPGAIHHGLSRTDRLDAPDAQSTLFDLIEEYLDEAQESEDRGPLDQILHPDMTEFSGEPDQFSEPHF